MALKDISYVLRSTQRKNLFLLLETPKTPTQLSKLLKSSLPNVSLKLADLQKAGLVKCMNPKERKGRIYKLTDMGVKVLKKIKSMEK